MSSDASLRVRVLSPVVRALAGGEPFTVVSNNCWGAHIYQALGKPYDTPFVGLFIQPDSYLALLSDFQNLMRQPLEFVAESRSEALNLWRERDGLTYPIARLGEVEINFLHYSGPEEASAKWTRRRDRMTHHADRLFFKFDDREGATADHIQAFDALPLAHKVCFTARPHAAATIVVPPPGGGTEVIDGLALAKMSKHRFNALRWISSLPAWAPVPSLI